MNACLSSQEQILFYSILFGMLLGMIYDFFRIIRLVHSTKQKLLFFQDIVYFLICGFLTFLFLLVVNYGQSRFFIIAGELIGWCIYNLTVGKVTYIIFKFMFGVCKKILQYIKSVFLKILSPIFNIVKALTLRCFPRKFKFIKEIKKFLLKSKTDLVYNVLKRFKFRVK